MKTVTDLVERPIRLRDGAEPGQAGKVPKVCSSSRLTAAGLSDSKPIADNSTEDGRARNRRVELVER